MSVRAATSGISSVPTQGGLSRWRKPLGIGRIILAFEGREQPTQADGVYAGNILVQPQGLNGLPNFTAFLLRNKMRQATRGDAQQTDAESGNRFSMTLGSGNDGP